MSSVVAGRNGAIRERKAALVRIDKINITIENIIGGLWEGLKVGMKASQVGGE